MADSVNRLKYYREQSHLTIRELSNLSGINYRTLQNWEQFGIEGGAVGKVKQVADVLGIWIDQLLTDEYDEVDE